MNYLVLGIWGITALSLVVGILLGLMRGSNRAVLRLVLILLCVIAAFFLKDIVADAILAYNLPAGEGAEPVTVQQYLLNMLPEQLTELGETVVLPLVKLLAGVVLFLVLFILLQFVSWIILFPIGKIFIKKGKKKHALIGGLVGAVQGVAIALCLCIPVTGLAIQTNRVLNIVSEVDLGNSTAQVAAPGNIVMLDAEVPEQPPVEGEQGSEGEQPTEAPKFDILGMLADFENDTVVQIYVKIGEKPFNLIASSKRPDGEKITLEGQVGTIEAAVRVYNALMENYDTLTNLDMSNINSLSDLKGIFASLDEIKDNLTDEQKSTINAVVSAAIDLIEVPSGVNEETAAFIEGFKDTLQSINFTDIGFANEIEIIEDLGECLQKGDDITIDDLSEVINTLSESTLILPILDGCNVDLHIDNATKNQLEVVFSELPEDTDQETANVLKKLLGLPVTAAE